MIQLLERRNVLRMLAASSVLGAGVVRSAVVARVESSRLTPLADQPYVPPTSLRTIADIYRRMTAPVRIEGSGPFAFVVDTGANQSVISTELAGVLGLPFGADAALNGVAGVQMTPTTIASLDLGGTRRERVTFSVLPAIDIGGAGMLGLDGLEDKRVTLDFRGEALRIDPSGRLPRDPDEITVRAKRRDGQLTLLDADLAGIAITAFLDSGAQNTIGNMALRQLAATRHPTTHWSTVPILSATGQTIAAELADLPNLRVAGLRLPNWPVAFADLHTFRMWKLVERPAILLGVDVLSRFETVCLDFARDEVRFRLPIA